MKIQRFSSNPLITPSLFEAAGVADEGANINGPSLLRVPDWVEQPLGRYYLYFAHHGGRSIRLAFADDVRGPYQLFQPERGVLILDANRQLVLSERFTIHSHIASPDVHLDEERRCFVMVFHGPTLMKGSPDCDQQSYRATSIDGLDFNGQVEPLALGRSYFRVWQWQDRLYAFGNRGTLYREPSGDARGKAAWEECSFNPIARALQERDGKEVVPRHCAVDLQGDLLTVYFTAVGHAPERILRAQIELSEDWQRWRATPVEEVLRSETDYEGIEFPVETSRNGSEVAVQQLRDPCFFRDCDGREYLFYAVAGETGLAGAEISK